MMIYSIHPEYLGAITPGFLIVTSMFYTRAEQNKRVGYWCMFLFFFFCFVRTLTYTGLDFMNGFAIIFLGLVSFGLLHSKVNEAPFIYRKLCAYLWRPSVPFPCMAMVIMSFDYCGYII